MSKEYLREFCETQIQKETLEAYIKHGGYTTTGSALGKSRDTVRDCIKAIEKRAAKCGVTESHDNSDLVPEGYEVQGTTTLRRSEEGLQWVKVNQTRQEEIRRTEEIINSMGAIAENYKPLKEVAKPKKTDNSILTIYPMGDPHLGMYAWADETGEDFDCDIAEKGLREAMAHLVNKTPPSETAIILNLGDFFHSDNQNNRTARAGNALDVDTRWARVLDIGMQLMMDCVYMALEKHKNVIVKNNIGNHDDHTSQALSLAMKYTFKNNPRVTIADAEKAFFVYEFGRNSIYSTHGHMIKPNKMQGVISNYFPELWGRTEHRLCLLGHFHHEDRKEDNGLVTEIFNTLAAQDAWHYASGYKSKRNMKALVLHREYGEIERYTYNIPRVFNK